MSTKVQNRCFNKFISTNLYLRENNSNTRANRHHMQDCVYNIRNPSNSSIIYSGCGNCSFHAVLLFDPLHCTEHYLHPCLCNCIQSLCFPPLFPRHSEPQSNTSPLFTFFLSFINALKCSLSTFMLYFNEYCSNTNLNQHILSSDVTLSVHCWSVRSHDVTVTSPVQQRSTLEDGRAAIGMLVINL